MMIFFISLTRFLTLQFYRDLLQSNSSIVAIGESGLDCKKIDSNEGEEDKDEKEQNEQKEEKVEKEEKEELDLGKVKISQVISSLVCLIFFI